MLGHTNKMRNTIYLCLFIHAIHTEIVKTFIYFIFIPDHLNFLMYQIITLYAIYTILSTVDEWNDKI